MIPEPAPGAAGGRAATRVALGFAAAVLVLQLASASRYGFFRDELYFLACGRHLAWGYVDQPPLIAAAARLSESIFGTWLPGLRLLPALAAAGLVLLTARLAVHLGGGALAAAAAATGAALGPFLLFAGHTLTMNAFEPLLWTALAFLVLRIAEGGERAATESLWPAVGAVAGLAMLNKHSALFWVLCLLGGLLLTARRRIGGRGLLVAVGLAALLVLPHAAWQAANGFPMLELLRNGQAAKNAPFTLAGFAGAQPLLAGPGFPLALLGLWALLRARLEVTGPAARALGIAFALLALLLAALGAKGYYLLPAYPPLLAAGGVALERVGWLASPLRRATALGLLLSAGLLLAPVTVPLLSPEGLARYLEALHVAPPPTERLAMGALPQHVADQFGWPELAAAVERVFLSLPPGERARARIFAQNYGEAGALDVLGRGLPPAASCHNNYWLWSREGPFPDVWLIVGGRAEDHRRSFLEVTEVERLPHDPRVMPYEDGLGVFVARRPAVDLARLFAGCRRFI